MNGKGRCISRDGRRRWDSYVYGTVLEVNVDKQDAENQNFHVKIAFKKKRKRKEKKYSYEITMITVGLGLGEVPSALVSV